MKLQTVVGTLFSLFVAASAAPTASNSNTLRLSGAQLNSLIDVLQVNGVGNTLIVDPSINCTVAYTLSLSKLPPFALSRRWRLANPWIQAPLDLHTRLNFRAWIFRTARTQPPKGLGERDHQRLALMWNAGYHQLSSWATVACHNGGSSMYVPSRSN